MYVCDRCHREVCKIFPYIDEIKILKEICFDMYETLLAAVKKEEISAEKLENFKENMFVHGIKEYEK
jgi:hypothetical protein